LVPVLESKDAILQREERVKVVRCKYLSLKNGEEDLDLVEPAGVDGQVDKDQV
jgi:hypothetical protein